MTADIEDMGSTDEAVKLEALRLVTAATGRANRLARWEFVYTRYQAGWDLETIGKHLEVSVSTIKRLLKRAALERQKKPGFSWPIDSRGLKICDIPHPMPKNEDPRDWAHARLRKKRFGRKILGQPRQEPAVGMCPVCCKGGVLSRPVYRQGRPLIDVLC